MIEADEFVFLWINGFVGRIPIIDAAMKWIVSDYLIPVSISLTLVGLWFAGKDRAAREKHQLCLFMAILSLALTNWSVMIINGIYSRTRPFDAHEVSMLFYKPVDPSFPANTAAAMFAISSTVWGINRRVGTALLLTSSIYGFARVYAGVHYPLDILGGAIIGIIIGFLVLKIRSFLDPVFTLLIRAARILCLA